MRATLLSGIFLLMILAGCGNNTDVDTAADTDTTLTETEAIEEFQFGVMSSYRMLAPESVDTSVENSVAPIWLKNQQSALDKKKTYTIDGYPEFDLTTSWEYKEEDKKKDIWEVTVTSSFPKDAWVDRLEEVYYIQDDGDGIHTVADAYVDKKGNPSSTARDKYRTYFNDKSERRDDIEGDSLTTAYQYALFDITKAVDVDELPVIDLFKAGEDRWSSKTVFSHNAKKNHDWTYWGIIEDVSIDGEQYYSRKDNIQTTLIIERGHADSIDWALDDTSPPTKKKAKKDTKGKDTYLFKGALKIQINDTTHERIIKGHYIITKSDGSTLEFTVDNDTITKL